MKHALPLLAIARSATALVVLVVLIMWMSGFFGDKIAPVVLAAAESEIPADATVATVVEETIPVLEEATGTVQAQQRTTVSSRILATIDEILVRAGDEVQQGDPLIRLDDAELLARVEEARRAVDAAAAAENRRAADLARARSLLAGGIMSRGEFDRIEAAARVAEAELERAREMLERARITATYAIIRAPVSGKIIDRLAEPGDTATPGTPLLSLYDPSALRIEVPVRESLVSRLWPGKEVAVRIGDADLITGLVDEIVPYAEPGSRTFLVKIGLPDREGLYAGTFGRVLIPAGERDRLLIPQQAVARVGQLVFAKAVTERNTVQRRLITVGEPAGEDHIEVLSGLAAGERVLVPPALDLEAGVDVGDDRVAEGAGSL